MLKKYPSKREIVFAARRIDASLTDFGLRIAGFAPGVNPISF